MFTLLSVHYNGTITAYPALALPEIYDVSSASALSSVGASGSTSTCAVTITSSAGVTSVTPGGKTNASALKVTPGWISARSTTISSGISPGRQVTSTSRQRCVNTALALWSRLWGSLMNVRGTMTVIVLFISTR